MCIFIAVWISKCDVSYVHIGSKEVSTLMHRRRLGTLSYLAREDLHRYILDRNMQIYEMNITQSRCLSSWMLVQYEFSWLLIETNRTPLEKFCEMNEDFGLTILGWLPQELLKAPGQQVTVIVKRSGGE